MTAASESCHRNRFWFLCVWKIKKTPRSQGLMLHLDYRTLAISWKTLLHQCTKGKEYFV